MIFLTYASNCGSLYKCESFAFYSFIVVQDCLKKKKIFLVKHSHFIHNNKLN